MFKLSNFFHTLPSHSVTEEGGYNYTEPTKVQQDSAPSEMVSEKAESLRALGNSLVTQEGIIGRLFWV